MISTIFNGRVVTKMAFDRVGYRYARPPCRRAAMPSDAEMSVLAIGVSFIGQSAASQSTRKGTFLLRWPEPRSRDATALCAPIAAAISDEMHERQGPAPLVIATVALALESIRRAVTA